MESHNGVHGQSGFTGSNGQQTTNRSIRPHSAAMFQQAISVTSHNNIQPATPVAGGVVGTQQAPPQGQPRFTAQRVVHGNASGINNTMAIRNHPGTSANVAPGNAQLFHSGAQLRPGPKGQQMIKIVGGNLSMAIATDPNAMAGLNHLRDTLVSQGAQVQNTQHYQNRQGHLSSQNHFNGQNYPNRQNNHGHGGSIIAVRPAEGRVSSGEDTPNVNQTRASTSANSTTSSAGQPSHQGPGDSPNATSEEPAEAHMGTEVTEDFQEHVNQLVAEKGDTFKNYIKDEADLARHKAAIWTAKWKGRKLENKAHDYPQTEAEISAIVERIFRAFKNTGGQQDPTSETADGNCLAVRVVEAMSPLETEIFSRDLLANILKVQLGKAVLPPNFKVVQEDSLMDKVREVVEALSFNKLLFRSAATNAEWNARLAANPAGERAIKKGNANSNRGKNIILQAESRRKGTERKGKGKRAAEDESAQEAPAEVAEASRPTKRARTTKKPSQAAQPQTQPQAQRKEPVQQVQRTTPGPSNCQALAHPASAAQGSIGTVPTHYAFGRNSQANADQNQGGLVQSSGPTGIANENLATNQLDGAGIPSARTAALQNQGSESEQPQSDTICHTWNEFLNFLALDGLDLDVPVDAAVHSYPLLDQPTIPRPPAQQLPAQEPQAVHLQQPKAVEQPQPIEREPVQQQAAERDSHQQVSCDYDDDDDLFGDREYQQSEYEKMQALLEPVRRFNGEN